MIVYHHPHFKRSFRKLDRRVKELAEEKVVLFKGDPFNVRLDTHRLRGKLKKLWSFSVDGRNRILFEFLNKAQTEAAFFDIGDHSEAEDGLLRGRH
jgi:mRNA-degrading endonuclease YafQ of YafQ-DinJ toxin-antitoxin module